MNEEQENREALAELAQSQLRLSAMVFAARRDIAVMRVVSVAAAVFAVIALVTP